MNAPNRTRAGHWSDQKPFVMPTAEEIAAADERHDMARANRAIVPLAVIALVLFVALVVWLVRSSFKP